MWRAIAWVVGAVAATAAILGTVMVVGMRTRYQPVQSAIRRLNRAVFNPGVMKSAGRPGARSIIRHVGRKTGTPYATPIGAITDGDEMLIVLPYGTSPDWFKNVVAAGSAAIVHEGETCEVKDPRVVPLAERLHLFPSGELRSMRLFGVDQVLTLRRLDPA